MGNNATLVIVGTDGNAFDYECNTILIAMRKEGVATYAAMRMIQYNVCVIDIRNPLTEMVKKTLIENMNWVSDKLIAFVDQYNEKDCFCLTFGELNDTQPSDKDPVAKSLYTVVNKQKRQIEKLQKELDYHEEYPSQEYREALKALAEFRLIIGHLTDSVNKLELEKSLLEKRLTIAVVELKDQKRQAENDWNKVQAAHLFYKLKEIEQVSI